MSYRFADIYHCCVYSEKIPDDGQKNCPKHGKFYSKNKVEKLVHLVGFITRTLMLHKYFHSLRFYMFNSII